MSVMRTATRNGVPKHGCCGHQAGDGTEHGFAVDWGIYRVFIGIRRGRQYGLVAWRE
jgi:hypothetical protein